MTAPRLRRAGLAAAVLVAAGLVSGCDADVDVHIRPEGARFDGTFWNLVELLPGPKDDGCTVTRRYLGLRVGAGEQRPWSLTPLGPDPAHPGRLGCRVVGEQRPGESYAVQRLDGRYLLDVPPSGPGQLFNANDTIRVTFHFPGTVVEASEGLKVTDTTATLDDPFVGFKGLRVVARETQGDWPLPVLAVGAGLVGAAVGALVGLRLGVRRPGRRR